MKLKYVLGILAVVAIGAGIYIALNSNKKKNDWDKAFDEKPVNKNDDAKKVTEPIKHEPVQDTFEKMQETLEATEKDKSDAVESISARHKEAADMMKESLSKIVDESSSVNTISENEEDLDKIDDALDKLLDD